MTADQLVLGQNLVWIFFSSTVAIFFAWTAWPRFCAEGFSRGVRVMLGVSMVGVGCAVHRSYWALWRWFRTQGDDTTALWFVNNADWLLLAVLLISFGYTLHLAPLLTKLAGYWWVLGGLCLAMGVFFSAILIT